MCYCGSENSFEQCCQPIINGSMKAHTAEQLMRSRFSAYCIEDNQYIHNTYAESKRAGNSVREIASFSSLADFILLKVHSHHQEKDTAKVHFSATYLCDGYACELEEVSNFIIEHDHWRYVDGELTPHPEIKLGRNDLCPCGGNKKYKKCHGK